METQQRGEVVVDIMRLLEQGVITPYAGGCMGDVLCGSEQ